jgi:hypothetical protein
MFARGELRVRRVDYENAPFGREVHRASPYRWWLSFIAWCYHALTGKPITRSVEWAALVADPLLLLLAGTGAVIFVFKKFGALSASLLSAGLVSLFPSGSEFLPGAPDDRGLALLCAVWSILLILAGSDPEIGEKASRRMFLTAGFIGGIGLWIDVPFGVVVVLGVAAGAIFASWSARPDFGTNSTALPLLPLREWGLGGAAASFAGYLIEEFPAHLGSWDLRSIHPLISLAWLGGGELLTRLGQKISRRRPAWSIGDLAVMVAGAAVVASIPILLWKTHDDGFFAVDLPSMTLSKLPGGLSARNFTALLIGSEAGLAIWATVLPGALIVLTAVLLFFYRPLPRKRVMTAVALGPALVALGFACWQISLWNVVDAALLGLLVSMAAGLPPGRRTISWFLGLAFSAAIVLGAVRLWPATELKTASGFTETEVISLVERDLAYWMAKHLGSADAVVLAPPDATMALYYYGGLRGVGTLGWENQDGIRGAVRIVSASTPEEAQELIAERNVTDLVIPSWDPYLDAYARMGEGELEGTFLERLHRWALPPWLRPVAYLMPTISGFQGQSVTILEVVDPQNDAVAASRLAEYFVDMGNPGLAADAAEHLNRFLGDVGASVARAEVAIARGQTDEFAAVVQVLLRRLTGGGDRSMAWDQRVRLAIVLARANRLDLARAQIRKCLEGVDPAKLRSLSTKSLFRFQLLLRGFGIEIADPAIRAESMDLLPSDLRARLERSRD